MKKLLLTIGLFVAVAISAQAQLNGSDTNLLKPEVASATPPTNSAAADLTATNSDGGTKYDWTLGAGGIVDNHGNNSQSFNVSFSFNPFSGALSSLWIGAAQSVAFRPWDAESDVDADWAYNLFGNFYVDPGWNVGVEYGDTKPIFKTGPELELQWYTSDDTFIFGTGDYNLQSSGRANFTWTVGFGFEFDKLKFW